MDLSNKELQGIRNTGTWNGANDVQDYKLLQELGVTGLWQFSGYLTEEKLQQLRGTRELAVYREMADNDATVGAINFAIEFLIKSVKWWAMPASDTPEALEYAEFLEECMNDMSHTWQSLISEIISMVWFGFQYSEIIYKKRMGLDQTDPTLRSKFNDGRIGWRKIPTRAQESILHWVFDGDGGIRGAVQLPPDGGPLVNLPIEKCLLFRTVSRKNNPQGRSMLRNAFVAWFRKKEMERIEAVGIERDLAGLPYLYVPPSLLDPNATDAEKAILEAYQKILVSVRNGDEQSALVFPSTFDDQGNRLVEFGLVNSNSRRTVNTNDIILRYQKDILTSVLADILVMGQTNVGSYALSSSKTYLFAVAIGSLMDEIANVFNDHAIVRLWKLNGFPMELMPKLVHGDLEKQDLQVVAQAVLQMAQSGFITPGGEDDERYFRELFGMPEKLGPDQHQIDHKQDNPDHQPARTQAEEEMDEKDDDPANNSTLNKVKKMIKRLSGKSQIKGKIKVAI